MPGEAKDRKKNVEKGGRIKVDNQARDILRGNAATRQNYLQSPSHNIFFHKDFLEKKKKEYKEIYCIRYVIKGVV